MLSLESSCPTRVDLAGGTLDIWPIHHLLPRKATVNIAIEVPATTFVQVSNDSCFHINSKDQNESITGKFDELHKYDPLQLHRTIISNTWEKHLPALSVTTSAESPKGAGLGGSSALSISLTAALWTMKRYHEENFSFSEDELCQFAKDAESSIIKIPTGCQDYWAAIRGGVNIISYKHGKTKIRTLKTQMAEELEKNMLVCFSGQSRQSAINNWEIYKEFFDRKKNVVEQFEQLGSLAESCALAFEEQNLEKALNYCHKEWLVRSKLWPEIETTKTKEIDKLARANGAIFTRVCGAGGGGAMLCLVPKEKKEKLANILKEKDIKIFEKGVAKSGLKVKEKNIFS